MSLKTLFNRHSPFKFDQAVGSTLLTQQGIAHVQIGKLNLQLSDCLYSLKSSLNILSVGRLHTKAGIFPCFQKGILYKISDNKSSVPLVRLIFKNIIYFKERLQKSDINCFNPTFAPGVARILRTTSTRPWHQRLSHVGQQILKKTAEVSRGLEGLDMADLTTCEICHLSKAQRYVTREPRPTPNEPLDELFVDKVG